MTFAPIQGQCPVCHRDNQMVGGDTLKNHSLLQENMRLLNANLQLERSNKELLEALDNLLLEKRCECKNCMCAHAALSAAEKERDEAKKLLEEIYTARDGMVFNLERERDEALAWGEKLKSALAFIAEEERVKHGFTNAGHAADQALSTPAPAALSHLRQEIRREALEEAATHFDSPDVFIYRSECSAAIRHLITQGDQHD